MTPLLRALASLAAAACPAAAQTFVLPVPRPVLPAAPIARPLALTLPALSPSSPFQLKTPSLLPAPALVVPRIVAAPVAPTKADILDALVLRAGASEEFYQRVRGLAARLPAPVLETALGLGYRVQVKAFVTQGRGDLPAVDDKGGGLHDWGEKGDLVIVAEKVLVDLPDADGAFRGRAEWQDSLYWENALVHELGHVMDRAFGLSARPAVRAAFDADFAAVPPELKRPRLPDGRVNKLYYFLQPDGERLSELSRQEACAEAFDVLLRGEASSFNYANFTAHFPRALAALRALLESRLGPLALKEGERTFEWGPFRALIRGEGESARVEIFYRGVSYSDPLALSAAAVERGEQALLREFFARLDELVKAAG